VSASSQHDAELAIFAWIEGRYNLETFLVALYDAFGMEPFTVKDLVGRLEDYGGIGAAVLPGDLAHEWSRIYDRRKEAFRKRLGWWLKNRQGRYAAGWAVVAAEDDTKAKVVRYAVNPAADFASDGTAGAGVLGF
jgi:hypothetical protein